MLRSALGSSRIISAAVTDLPWQGADGNTLTDVSAYAKQMTYANIMYASIAFHILTLSSFPHLPASSYRDMGSIDPLTHHTGTMMFSEHRRPHPGPTHLSAMPVVTLLSPSIPLKLPSPSGHRPTSRHRSSYSVFPFTGMSHRAQRQH